MSQAVRQLGQNAALKRRMRQAERAKRDLISKPRVLTGEEPITHRFLPSINRNDSPADDTVDVGAGSWIRSETEVEATGTTLGSTALPVIIGTLTVNSAEVPSALTLSAIATATYNAWTNADRRIKLRLMVLTYASNVITNFMRHQLSDHYDERRENWWFKKVPTGEILNTDYKNQLAEPTDSTFGLHASRVWHTVPSYSGSIQVAKHYQHCIKSVDP